MKTRILFGFATIAGLALMLGGPVTSANADPTCGDVRQDRRDIRRDVRDIRHDRFDIRQDRRQIGKLDGRLVYDVNHGKFWAASGVEARINRDRHDIGRDQRDVRHDVGDVKHDVRDLRHDRADLRSDR